MSSNPRRLDTICVYCGSSDAAAPAWLDAAARFGALLAREDLRLVYGGGGMGLMGACARAALKAGGRVLGIIPDFLTQVEHTVPGVDTVVVSTMHERKARMFEESDAFAVRHIRRLRRSRPRARLVRRELAFGEDGGGDFAGGAGDGGGAGPSRVRRSHLTAPCSTVVDKTPGAIAVGAPLHDNRRTRTMTQARTGRERP